METSGNRSAAIIMNRYKFLFKPLFFIFNLLFACWLVLWIEKLSPSDFGKNRSLFESAPKPDPSHYKDSCRYAKKYLMHLCSDYNSGQINGSELQQKLKSFLETPVIEWKDGIPVGQAKPVIRSK